MTDSFLPHCDVILLLPCSGLVLVEYIAGRIVLARSHVAEYLSEGLRCQSLFQSNRAKDCAHEHPQRNNFGDDSRIEAPGSRLAEQDLARPLSDETPSRCGCHLEFLLLIWSEASRNAPSPVRPPLSAPQTVRYA